MFYFLALLAILLLVVTITSLRVYYGFKPPCHIETGTPADQGFDYQQVWIPTKQNKKLYAWYIPSTQPDKVKAATLIMVHGWGGNAEFALPLALPFKDKNINLLLFDQRNHGKSDKHVFSSIGTMQEDVSATIDWVRKEKDKNTKIAIIGHSIGGAAVLYTAVKRNDIEAVLSLSTFAHVRKIVASFLTRRGVMKAHTPAIIRFLEKLIGHSLDESAPIHTIKHLSCPALLIHGTADETIPFTAFEELCKVAITHNISTIRCLTLKDGNHFPIEQVVAHSNDIMRFLKDTGILKNTN